VWFIAAPVVRSLSVIPSMAESRPPKQVTYLCPARGSQLRFSVEFRENGDGNGLVYSIDVDAEFMAPQPGSYRLSARFGRNRAIDRSPGLSESNFSVSAEVRRTLPSGPAHLKVRFDPNALEQFFGSGKPP
jgi:hypothetical protein